MTETMISFLGVPIEGSIRRSNKRDQKTLAEFTPIMRAVLDDPTVVEFGWVQYTPYFNDGDPCVFSAHGPWVLTDADDPSDRGDEHAIGVGVDGSHKTLGGRPWTWSGPEKVYGAYEGPDEARYLRCVALGEAIESGEFDDVLLAAFGDHAEITVTKSSIRVEFYEHD